MFLKVFRKLHTFQQDSAFFTWLYRIAVNTATDHLARKSRAGCGWSRTTGVLERGDRDDAESPTVRRSRRRAGRGDPRDPAELPEKYRTILILREYEDLSYTEMAEVLDCSIGTVESRLFRARQRFKEALERHHPDLVPTRGGAR